MQLIPTGETEASYIWLVITNHLATGTKVNVHEHLFISIFSSQHFRYDNVYLHTLLRGWLSSFTSAPVFQGEKVPFSRAPVILPGYFPFLFLSKSQTVLSTCCQKRLPTAVFHVVNTNFVTYLLSFPFSTVCNAVFPPMLPITALSIHLHGGCILHYRNFKAPMMVFNLTHPLVILPKPQCQKSLDTLSKLNVNI